MLLFNATWAQRPTYVYNKDLLVGADRFDVYVDRLKEAGNIGVVANHATTVKTEDGERHLIDYLLSEGVGVSRAFAPEHGFRGKADAGEKVEDGRDAATGLSVISLYGSHKKPTPQDLEGIDLMVFDLQDVGARFYTYISTMYYVMEACAEEGIPVMILDRPNPNGFYVDGPLLEPAYKSFVGMLPIPVVHGMTVGELAQMINGEGWLPEGATCSLVVLPCEGYDHNKVYVLPKKPSPNLPTITSILLFPSLCFFEGTEISVGRGTDKPFEVFGHPNLSIGSYLFVPKPNEGAKHPKHENVPCIGWDLSEIGAKRVMEKQELILDWLVNAYHNYPEKESFFLKNGFFEKLAGIATLREQIISGMNAEEIRASWQSDLVIFKARRQLYLLYPEN